MKRILLFVIAISILPILYGQNAERIAILDEYIEESVAQGIIPGGVFKISLKGNIIYDRAVGYADSTQTRPYQNDDIFRLASMTKAVTSVAIMQLYENGQLLIDDPVANHIPAFADTKVLDTFNEVDSTYTVKDLDRPVTIRHLLTHTSGIYYGVFEEGGERAVYIKNDAMDYGFFHPTRTTKEMAEHIATLPLAHQPGTKWTYGLNMEVLGHIVEVVSGMSLGDYFKQNIFDPLGMNDTHFFLPAEKASRLVPVYMHTKEGVRMNKEPGFDYPLNEPVDHFAGGGGLSSTVGDYLKFVQALVNGGFLNGQRILGSKTIDYMRAPQTLHLNPPVTDHSRPVGNTFGLGFATFTDESIGAIPFSPGTYLWGGFFNTKFWIDPKEDFVFVGLTQVYPFAHPSFWDKLYAITYSILEDESDKNNFQNKSEMTAVYNAVLDYVEALYEVDASRIKKSVHPQLRKRGYWYNDKEEAYMNNLDMTYEHLVDLAGKWNKAGDNVTASSPKKIEIYDINDKTASAKLTAEWGIDYFHLAKLEGKWQIMNVLWQSLRE